MNNSTTFNVTILYLVTASVGGRAAYTETPDGIAIQRVSDMGGKVSTLVRKAFQHFFC